MKATKMVLLFLGLLVIPLKGAKMDNWTLANAEDRGARIDLPYGPYLLHKGLGGCSYDLDQWLICTVDTGSGLVTSRLRVGFGCNPFIDSAFTLQCSPRY